MKQTIPSPIVRIEMLGGLRVWHADQCITHFSTYKDGALLAYLAFHSPRATPREMLCEIFWPDKTPKLARGSLSTALSDLRTLLEPPGVEPETVLIANNTDICLDADALTTDVRAFEWAVRVPDGMDEDTTISRLSEAVVLYQGELLPGYYEEWIQPQCERLAEACIQALRLLVRLHAKRQELPIALEYAQRAVSTDPIREEAHRDLIQLFIRTNQLSAAQQQYRELEAILAKTFSAKPSAAARQLLQIIEAKLQAAPIAAPSKSTPPAVVPAPDVKPEPRGAFPTALNPFFGRQNELTRLETQLAAPETRLLTIVGIGGAGKTRLVQEAAIRLSPAFSGAVWFVSLVDLSDAAHIPDAVAGTMGLPRSPQVEPLEQVIEILSARPSLLILDSYEHLLETGTGFAATLLERIAHLKILAASRQTLGLTLEREFVLTPMPIPENETDVGRLREYASVQMLVNRARFVCPDFDLTPHNAAEIAAICCRLEGIPLALELAAARFSLLTPAQMLTQLENRFRLLVSHLRDVPPRHRALLSAMEWSYQLLAPDLRMFLARLSVFGGGWTAESAEAVCDDPFALDSLAQLRECSLLFTEERGERMRFRMLETVREFAHLKLTEPERTLCRQRHLDCFLQFAEEQSSQPEGAKTKAGYARLEEEYENLRGALAWARPQPDLREKTLRLANALYPFWKRRGSYRDGLETLLLAADEDAPSVTLPTRARALHGAGSLNLAQGDYAYAQILLTRCLELRRELGDTQGEAATLQNLGATAEKQDKVEEARGYFERCLALRRERQDQVGVADALLWLSIVAQRQGDMDEAQRLLDEVLLCYEHDDSTPSQMTYVLNNLGVLAHNRGEFEKAQAFYEQCLVISHQHANQPEIARTLNNLGNVLREMEQTEQAVDALTESLALWRKMENRPEIADTLTRLGLACCQQQKFSASRQCFAEAWAFYQPHDHREGMSYVLVGRADAALGEGQPEQAARLLAQAAHEREVLSITLPPSDRRDWEKTLARTQAALSEAAFQEAWRQGSTLPLTRE